MRVPLRYSPAPHESHDVAPAAENSPDGQFMQPSVVELAPVMPPYVFAGHKVQSDSESWLAASAASSARYFPSEHDVHELCAASAV